VKEGSNGNRKQQQQPKKEITIRKEEKGDGRRLSDY